MAEDTNGMRVDVYYEQSQWIVRQDDLRIMATGPCRENATIRCTLSVCQGEQLIYRDTVNLTSGRRRAQVVRALQAKRVTLTEAVLLALDEAIRQTPQDSRTAAAPMMSAPPPEFVGTVPTLDDLEAQVHGWLCLADTDVYRLMLAAVVGHRVGLESPWLLIVGPPSSAKTELLRMLSAAPGIFPLSSLTARTLASGLDTPGTEPSLLSRLHQEVLVLKDFTTILKLAHDEQQAILAQLREIHDGYFDKSWGTGKTLHWEGHLGFLAGVTPMIDQHHTVMGLLGPRFLLLRLRYTEAERPATADRALDNAEEQPQRRRELVQATAAFLAHLPTEAPDLGPGVRPWLVAIADLVTHARSPVSRDRRDGALLYAPEPEMPARFVLQLDALAQGLVLVAGGTALTPDDRRCLARVAWDSIPVFRGTVLQLLTQMNLPWDTHAIAATLDQSPSTVRRTLEDLQALKLVECHKGGTGKADAWRLQPRWRRPLLDLLRRLDRVPHPAW